MDSKIYGSMVIHFVKAAWGGLIIFSWIATLGIHSWNWRLDALSGSVNAAYYPEVAEFCPASTKWIEYRISEDPAPDDLIGDRWLFRCRPNDIIAAAMPWMLVFEAPALKLRALQNGETSR